MQLHSTATITQLLVHVCLFDKHKQNGASNITGQATAFTFLDFCREA